MLSRLQQAAAAIESVVGTAETLDAGDAKTLFYEPKIVMDPEMHERNPERNSFSSLAQIPGKRPGKFTGAFNLKGSGTPTTSPDWIKYLQACGVEVNALNAITIGAVTGGPFQHGETITGGTSSATGRVVIATANGTTTLYFVTLSGTFDSGETITGGISSATATTGSTASAVGKEVREIVYDVLALTISDLLGGESGGGNQGIAKTLKGARGKFKMSFMTGKPVKIDLELDGVEAGIVDADMFSPTYETTKPPAFLNATLSIGALSAKISQLSIDHGSVTGMSDDPEDDRGISSFKIVDRKITGQFDPEMTLVADHDFYGLWFAGTEMVLDVQWGTTAGNKFRFYGPTAQYVKIAPQDRNGIAVSDVSFALNGSENPGNDAFCLLIL